MRKIIPIKRGISLLKKNSFDNFAPINWKKKKTSHQQKKKINKSGQRLRLFENWKKKILGK